MLGVLVSAVEPPGEDRGRPAEHADEQSVNPPASACDVESERTTR
jgi:hypothetical protein